MSNEGYEAHEALKELYAKVKAELDAALKRLEAAASFEIGGSDLSPIRLERVGQIKGPDLWAVRVSGRVLNKDGEWEWEPSPSSRDKSFMKRCRFKTYEEAYRAFLNRKDFSYD